MEVMGIRYSNPCPLKQEVKRVISTAAVVVYTREETADCRLILHLLFQMGLYPQVFNLEETGDVEQALFQLLGIVEYPVVFILNSYIGGYKQLLKGLRTGHIQTILRKGGIEFEQLIC